MFNNKQLERKIDKSIDATNINNQLIQKFLTDFTSIAESLRKESIKNSAWAKEFHRLLIKEISENQTQGRVYGINYYNPVLNVRRPMLVIADNLDNALIIGENALHRVKEDSKEWIVESQSYLDIPAAPITVEQVSKIDNKISPIAKPAEVFINDLKLVKEKYTTTPVEKRTIEGVIKRIRASYNLQEIS